MTIRDKTTEAKSRKSKRSTTNEIPFAAAVPISDTDHTSSVRTVTATPLSPSETAIPSSAPYANTPPRPYANIPSSAPYEEPEPSPTSSSQILHVVAPARLPEGATFDAYFLAEGVDLQITARVPHGGVVPGSLFSVPYEYNRNPPEEPRLIRVMAPGNLNAGDQFQATIDGIQFYAVVPEGGVRQGEYFHTYHPSTVALPTRSPGSGATARAGPGQGNRWKTDLVDGMCDQPGLCCMASVCPAVVHFQVLQRLSPRNQPCCPPCPVMTFLLVLWCCLLPLPTILGLVAGDLDQYIGYIFLAILAIGLWMLLCMCCTRRSVREHYGISDHPRYACKSEKRAAWEHDQRVTCFCLPCSAAQLANQTHDHKDYPYRCCSKTGLPSDAPAIV